MKRFLAITLGAMLVLSSLTYGKGKIQNGIDIVKASQETSTTIKTETGSITKLIEKLQQLRQQQKLLLLHLVL